VIALGAAQEVVRDVQSAATGRLPLFADYSLADPWFLALVPLAWWLVWWGRSRRARPAGRVPALPGALLPRTWRQRLAWLPPVLQACALSAAIVALARPLRANELLETTSEGVDIALVIDRSSSMSAEDLAPGRTRMDVVKEVVGDFAERRMTDRVGASDSVALLAFGRYPQLYCPFTLDVGALRGFLERVDFVRYEGEDGTAIGAGLAKAVQILVDAGGESKVVVLLTDGENNVNDIPPLDAADYAAEKGVRVYTVLAGRYVFMQDGFGRKFATERELDSRELEEIARRTGGRFFRVRDEQSLEQVYAEIEELERTPRTEARFTESYDLYPGFLELAVGAYLGAWLLASTWLRRLA
jgi:Ca-activated chloride channel family protein